MLKMIILINEKKEELEIVMSILSNYVPECLVNVSVSCNIKILN